MMKIATLGPAGTFSHAAVLKYKKNAEIVFVNTIWDVFEAVNKKRADKGIVPIENSISGSVGFTLDALMDFDLKICKELVIPVKHNLAANGPLEKIKYLYTHPQSYAQCEKFIRQKLNGVEIIITPSNSESALKLSKNKNSTYAAIVPDLAMKKYKLKALAKDIQTSNFNVTRFVTINHDSAKRTGKDKSSLAIYPHIDRPGLLYNLVGEFAKRRINLTNIQSRPSKGRLGDYIIYIDIDGHKDDRRVKNAFEALEKDFFITTLGSYPREY